jgi:hypothetical protein
MEEPGLVVRWEGSWETWEEPREDGTELETGDGGEMTEVALGYVMKGETDTEIPVNDSVFISHYVSSKARKNGLEPRASQELHTDE